MQTRKRIGKACDQCRRRKTKCDGSAACNACSSIGLECSYGSRMKQARGPEYVAYLEQTIQRLKSRPDSSTGSHSGSSRDISESGASFAFHSPHTSDGESADSGSTIAPGDADIHLAMDNGPSGKFLLTVDCTAFSEPFPSYYGSASGLEVLRRMHLCIHGSSGTRSGQNDPAMVSLLTVLDRSIPARSLSGNLSEFTLWPSKRELEYYVDVAFTEAFSLWPFLDRSTLEGTMETVYAVARRQSFGDTQDSLALLYMVVALGQLYDTLHNESSVFGATEDGTLKGAAYFRKARTIVDPSDCSRNLTTIQTVMCMSLYLLSASAPSAAHSFIASAGAAAARAGLHDPRGSSEVSQEEQLARERTYKSLNVLDTYVMSFLGLPSNFHDFALSRDGLNLSKAPQVALHCQFSAGELMAADAHLELSGILSAALASHYFKVPPTKTQNSFNIPCEVVRQLHAQLETWRERHTGLMHHDPTSTTVSNYKSQAQLRFAFTYVQMIAYSPFLHYVTDATNNKHGDGYEVGAKCVAAAIEAVEILQLYESFKLFNEARPFIVANLMLAATTLLTVELCSTNDPALQAVMAASKGMESFLQAFAARTAAGAQCLNALQAFYTRARVVPKEELLHLPGSMSGSVVPGSLPANSLPSTPAIDPFGEFMYFPVGSMTDIADFEPSMDNVDGFGSGV